MSDGPVLAGPLDTIQFANTPATPPPTFETTTVANKTNIVFNTPSINAPLAITGVVNLPTASTGLSSLTFSTPNNGDETVSFLATPPGVVTSFFGGTFVDVTNVTGVGVAAGTTLLLNGGGSLNTLNYDAGGLVPTVTSSSPGVVLITLPGFGSVQATDYQAINIIDTGPTPVTPPAITPVDPVNSVEGFQLVNAVVGTFTFPIASFFPPGTVLAAGLPASDFTATYDWGDPSPDLTAGTITQDAQNPSVYDVTGTHIYTDPGVYTTTLTVSFIGGSVTGLVGGIPVTVTIPPATASTGSTANVTDGVLAVTAFPISGTEGVPIGPLTIASFIDAGGPDPVGDYAVSVAITGPNGFSTTLPGPFTVTQQGTSAQFDISTPAFTLPEEGTYQVLVSVTDTSDPAPAVTASGGWRWQSSPTPH